MKGLPFFFIFTFSIFPEISFGVDTLTPNQSISDGQTLVSSAQGFELGFFSPSNSGNWYLGIWYKNIPLTVIWVANRNNPLTDQSGVLKIGKDGNMVILNGTMGHVVWSSNSSVAVANPIAQLLESGNLVLRDDTTGNSDSYLWQSFDFPCDTLIQGMKLGRNLKTGWNWNLSSWKNANDPSIGDYIYNVDARGLPQLVLHNGPAIVFRSGPWDGVRFGGGPKLHRNYLWMPIFVFNDEYAYYTFENNQNSTMSRFVVSGTGSLQYFSWNTRRREWTLSVTLQKDSCDNYAACGAYGTCNINDSPICNCLQGFRPKSIQDWNAFDTSAGCVRKSQWNCGREEGFRRFERLKLPDTSHFLMNKNMSSRVECENACLANCSCVAYANTEISGCVVWYGDLIDIREYSEGGQDLYIRMAASELHSNKGKRVLVIVIVAAVLGMLLLGIISFYVFWKKRRTNSGGKNPDRDYTDYSQEEDLELHVFDLVTIEAATNNFSLANKIGEGGFGPVYKGQLLTGQEIAVKRLSKDSGQGTREFQNEVILIAKLQHRNLVSLLGCCIQGKERMLIYEYMPNKSLDSFIFGQPRSTALNWQKRFDIIMGIARGLLYLHQDSRLRIIHRDLKVSNVLLDKEMNPKISDFGIARTFGSDQTEENTKRVVGTYGYMPPEYAIDGYFSVKSDVYSFGVIVLEMVSGKRNRGFYHPDHDHNLLGHAWKLWNEGKALELTDPLMENPGLAALSEVLRCIHVGLLCVQQRPEDRPNMSFVVLMLGSENAILPQPMQPGFFTERFLTDKESSSTERNVFTANHATVTILEGR